MTWLRRATATLGLLLCVASEAVLAQSLENRPQSEETSDRVLEDYSECVAAKRTGKGSLIKKFLGVPVGGALPPHVAMQLTVSDCLEGAGQLRMAPELFGRSLYSALYRRDFRKTEPTGFVAATSYEGEFEPGTVMTPNQIYLRKVGDCGAVENVTAAHRFVIAKVWSAEEEAVLPQVIGALSQCYAVGEKIVFSRSMLKGILAESLYKYRHRMTQTQVASVQ
jgi:hypothetical protein